MDLNWLQDWTAPGGGLSGYAYLHDTEPKWFSLQLDSTDADVIATGQVFVVSGSYGGTFGDGSTAASTSTWPTLDKPDITVPARSVSAASLQRRLTALADVPETALRLAAKTTERLAREEGQRLGPVALGKKGRRVKLRAIPLPRPSPRRDRLRRTDGTMGVGHLRDGDPHHPEATHAAARPAPPAT